MNTINPQSQSKIHRLEDYQPSDFLIDSVFLNFNLKEGSTSVKTILNIHRNPLSKNKNAPLVLNGENMQLESVILNGTLLSSKDYQVDDEFLTIKQVPDKFILETEVIIKPQENTKLSGLYKSRGNFCTQCEAEGFRRITYYLDRPDVLSHFSTTIIADKTKYPILLSNGNLLSTRELENNRHWVHWEDPSLKPSYLFALVAGDFDLLQDKFVTQSGRTVDLRLYLEKGFGDQGDYSVQALKRAMRWDEETFGREYDLDIYMIVGVSDFNMGAMENKGLNLFNTKYILAKPDTASDQDYVAIENVIGHEYFHNWSGNRVTCRDWFQITLKEGLTVLRDQLFTEDMTSRAVARLDSVNVVRARQFLEDAGPLAHPIRPRSYMEINNFYTVTVYRKGAEVIRMIRTLLSPEGFRKGMDLYFLRHDGHAVTTEDFVKAMEDASGEDLTQFRLWYEQAGTPVLDISSQYDEQQKIFKLTVKQQCPPTPGQPHKDPMHMPLAFKLIFPNNHLKFASRILEIKKPVETFVFENISEKPVPSLLRDFSAPVKLQYPYSFEELALLLQLDDDAFSRWDAGQQFLIKLIAERIQQGNVDQPAPLNDLFVRSISKLFDEVKDAAFLSRLLMMPTENYLLSLFPKTDVNVIHHVRESIKQQLALQLETQFSQNYKANLTPGVYQYSPQNMGKRNLKNTCLYYLLETEKAEYRQLAYQQFIESNNMTDAIGGLVALNNHDCPERLQALDEFYQRWQSEPLVVNKWLLLHASAALSYTLDKVKELIKHPAFSMSNPNNVYALLGGFGDNTYCFHDASGKGYRFIADQVLVLDATNPQVASRTIQPLTQWELVDAKRAQLMKQELKRIQEQPELSKDILELATKALKD